MFEFKVTLNDNDYLLFNQYQLLHSLSGKKYLMTYRLAVPFIFLMFVVMLRIARMDLTFALIETVLLSIATILWMIFSNSLLIKALNKNIIKTKKMGRLAYHKEDVITFGEESIQTIGPDTESKTNYSLIEKIAITDKAIYIYFSSIQAFMLPTNVFSDEIEKQKFLEFINSKVNIPKDRK